MDLRVDCRIKAALNFFLFPFFYDFPNTALRGYGEKCSDVRVLVFMNKERDPFPVSRTMKSAEITFVLIRD